MKSYGPLVMGLLFLVVGLSQTAFGANSTGTCYLTAVFGTYNAGTEEAPDWRWRVEAVDCAQGSCPKVGGVDGVCHEYLVSAHPQHPTYSCACKYVDGETVTWNFTLQECDGFYTRDNTAGGALDPESHYCQGPCGTGKTCKLNPALPTAREDSSDVTARCSCY